MEPTSPSAARIAANIANAQKSTGPRTSAGKARVSQNARKHGFTGAHFFCPDSLQPLLAQIEEEYRHAIQPKGLLEEDAFLQLRNARFNMERAQLLMEELGAATADRGVDPLADPATCKQYLLYQRYFNQAQSGFHRHLRLLRQLQTDRVLREQMNCAESFPGLANVAAALRPRKGQPFPSPGAVQPQPPPADIVPPFYQTPILAAYQAKPDTGSAA